MFLIPLAGGVLPFAGIGMIHKMHYPSRISFNLYNSGIATLTVGSCFKGALEIYGTSSAYVPVYLIAGVALTVLGILFYMFFIKKNSVKMHQ
jgi:hypothetical protein